MATKTTHLYLLSQEIERYTQGERERERREQEREEQEQEVMEQRARERLIGALNQDLGDKVALFDLEVVTYRGRDYATAETNLGIIIRLETLDSSGDYAYVITTGRYDQRKVARSNLYSCLVTESGKVIQARKETYLQHVAVVLNALEGANKYHCNYVSSLNDTELVPLQAHIETMHRLLKAVWEGKGYEKR